MIVHWKKFISKISFSSKIDENSLRHNGRLIICYRSAAQKCPDPGVMPSNRYVSAGNKAKISTWSSRGQWYATTANRCETHAQAVLAISDVPEDIRRVPIRGRFRMLKTKRVRYGQKRISHNKPISNSTIYVLLIVNYSIAWYPVIYESFRVEETVSYKIVVMQITIWIICIFRMHASILNT